MKAIDVLRRSSAIAVLLAAGAAVGSVRASPPNVVFVLLDTTRADRLSAWGNPNSTTPHLDALARTGIRFARHFANAHATRPSMPQLMSGRYYQPNVLREFRPETHPRDWPFAVPDPTLALLPEMLSRAGFHLAGVSAHPWISRASRLGRPFQVFEEPDVPASRGHADAAEVVTRGLRLWRERPRDRPTLLYLHFMDPHIPRHVEPGGLRFGLEDPVARARFDAAGEPNIGDPWHAWDRSDARAFTPRDVAFFTAVYDTILARLDSELGRFLAGLRADDPDLRHTLIVVTADHGEELGEHGRISHEPSLDDAVQHIPWILAGWNVGAGQTAWGITENVDVVPTLLRVIGVSPPAKTRFDGIPMVSDGRICEPCLRSTAVYAWEEYRALRLGSNLVREELPNSFAARCQGSPRLLSPDRRERHRDARRERAGTRMLAVALDDAERAFRHRRYHPASRRFTVLPPFWRLGRAVSVHCVLAGPATARDAFDAPGWIWTGRGLTVLHDANATPNLEVDLEVPDGEYDVALGTRALPAPPRFFGFARWLRRGIRRHRPTDRVSVPPATAVGGSVRVVIPADRALHRHVVAIHLAPRGITPSTDDVPRSDPALRERLRSLGYVE